MISISNLYLLLSSKLALSVAAPQGIKQRRLLRSSNSRNLPTKIRKSVHFTSVREPFLLHTKVHRDLCFAYVASFLFGRQISTANCKQACIVCGYLARCFIKK